MERCGGCGVDPATETLTLVGTSMLPVGTIAPIPTRCYYAIAVCERCRDVYRLIVATLADELRPAPGPPAN